MPLKPGKENIGSNIAELIRTYRTTGKIGNAKPSSLAKARKQAIAIAYAEARKKS